MENLLQIKLISCLLVLIVTFIGGIYPFTKSIHGYRRYSFPIGEPLTAGIFLGAGLLHMLNDATGSFIAEGYRHYPFSFLLAGIAFLVLLLLEHIGREVYESSSDDSSVFAILAMVLLSIHSFLAGAALGLSHTFSMVIIILFAIVAHKWAASFALAIQLNKSHLRTSTNVLLFSIFAITTPLGILLGNTVLKHFNHYPLAAPVFTALSAGTFLYLGTLHGLKQSVLIQKCCDLKHFSFVILGFVIMAFAAIAG